MNRIAAFTPALLLVTGFALVAGPALAQVTTVAPITTPDGQKAGGGKRNQPSAPPPSGIPGSRADSSLSSPAERGMIDMPPNEALFDAINRGDLNGTKEAIGRGADIHGHNVLGLTPLELAVDLGRNDISFLLLSLRGGDGYSASRAPRPGTPAAAPTRAEQRAEQQAKREQAAAAKVAARSEPRGPVPSRNARLFAGDGGSPVPQAGFLGFDSAR